MHAKNEAIAKKAKANKPKTKESKKTLLEGLAENRLAERSFQARKRQGTSAQEAKKFKPINPEKPASPYELPDDLDDWD